MSKRNLLIHTRSVEAMLRYVTVTSGRGKDVTQVVSIMYIYMSGTLLIHSILLKEAQNEFPN